MAPTKPIGANIYRLRKEVRLTQDDLDSFLGVTKASVSKWETGQSYPDIELLPKIDYIESWLEDVNVIGTSTPREDALNKINACACLGVSRRRVSSARKAPGVPHATPRIEQAMDLY